MNSTLKKIFENNIKLESECVHSMHAFPCKFPGSLPNSIIKEFSNKKDVICDPFVGSGTTLVEASLLGHESIGVDINPIACLLSKVKSTPIPLSKLNKIPLILENIKDDYSKAVNNNFSSIKIVNFKSIDHWFKNNVIRELSLIKENILKVSDKDLRDLLLIAFSSIIVRVSNQESDTRYAAINKNIKNGDTLKKFIDRANEYKESMKNFWNLLPDKKIKSKVILSDTRSMKKIKSNSVDLIITSPPYANTYDYYLYHKQRKLWLDMDVFKTQNSEIGSRREFSSLKESPIKWEEDIKECLLEFRRITKPKGKIFIIIGDSIINKKLIKSDDLFQKVAIKIGFKHISTESTLLKKHSRQFNPKFQTNEKKEYLIYFENIK